MKNQNKKFFKELTIRIGKICKKIRTGDLHTLQQESKLLGFSIAMISKFENGKSWSLNLFYRYLSIYAYRKEILEEIKNSFYYFPTDMG